MWWLIIVIFVCCLCLSVTLFVLQYTGYCPSAPGLPLADLRYSRTGPVKEEGLPVEALDRLASFSLPLDETDEEGHTGKEECLICQEDLAAQRVAKLPCSHMFHKACVRDWLGRKASCPTCRCQITSETLSPEQQLMGGSLPSNEHPKLDGSVEV